MNKEGDSAKKIYFYRRETYVDILYSMKIQPDKVHEMTRNQLF